MCWTQESIKYFLFIIKWHIPQGCLVHTFQIFFYLVCKAWNRSFGKYYDIIHNTMGHEIHLIFQIYLPIMENMVLFSFLLIFAWLIR